VCEGRTVRRGIHPDGLRVRGGTGFDDQDEEVVHHQRSEALHRSDPVLWRRHERRAQLRSIAAVRCRSSRRSAAGGPAVTVRGLLCPQLVARSTGPD